MNGGASSSARPRVHRAGGDTAGHQARCAKDGTLHHSEQRRVAIRRNLAENDVGGTESEWLSECNEVAPA
eukprot:1700850-Prymnesium_polylepis.1